MNIGIDIDGVLTNEHDYVLKRALEFIKENGYNYKLENKDSYYTTKMFNWTDEVEDLFWNKSSYAFDYAQIPTINENAARVINNLKKNNKIYIITSRIFTTEDSERGEKMRTMVKDWLTKNNVNYDKLIFAGHGKKKECMENNIDIMIEDSPENITILKDYIKQIICYDTCYNRDIKGDNIIRCYNWNEIEKVLLKTK